jgi:hypothetical protein
MHFVAMFLAKWFVIAVVVYTVYWLFIRHPYDGTLKEGQYDDRDED